MANDPDQDTALWDFDDLPQGTGGDQQQSFKKQKSEVESSTTATASSFNDRASALDVPESFREKFVKMKGRNLVMVMEKNLSKTDLSKRHHRLWFPFNSNEFLTEDEKNYLVEDGKEKFFTTFFDTRGKELSISIQKRKNYVLGYPWGYLATDESNNLAVNDRIQLWAFRVGTENKLCLAIVKKDAKPPIVVDDMLADEPLLKVDDMLADEPPLTVDDMLADEPPLTVDHMLADEPPLMVDNTLADEPPITVDDTLADEPPVTVDDMIADEPPLKVDDMLADEPLSKVDFMVDNLKSQVDNEPPSEVDVMVDNLRIQVEKCQEIMNKVEIAGLQKMTVERQKSKLKECEQPLDQRKELIVKYRNSLKDLIKTDP